MFVIRMYYARGYIYGVNGIFTQPNISNKGQNSELGWWLYLKWNNHEMLVSWFHDMRWWYHGIMTWPCWFQNWLHQRTHISSNCCTCFGSTYTKIGTIQRRLAWPLRKDDTQNREAFHIFCTASSWYLILNIRKLPLEIIFGQKRWIYVKWDWPIQNGAAIVNRKGGAGIANRQTLAPSAVALQIWKGLFQ